MNNFLLIKTNFLSIVSKINMATLNLVLKQINCFIMQLLVISNFFFKINILKMQIL